LEDLPLLRERFGTGEVSLDQVDAISKLATPDTEEAVIGECLGWSNAALDRAARRSRPPSTEETLDAIRERWLSIQYTLDGIRGHMDVDLPGAEMLMVETAVRTRADRIPPNPETGRFDAYQARMADGLVEVCTTTGDESSPVQVTVFADLEALTQDPETTGVAELAAGPVIASETARRLSCDSILECVITDHGRVLGIGRRSRLIPAWLRRQLWFRDGGCRFPGCPERHFVHAHHRKHWADLGPTDLENLVLLCGYHHRFVHEHGWRVQVDPEGRPIFIRPNGQIYPPQRPALDPRLATLARRQT
jgi:hypothetical protein